MATEWVPGLSGPTAKWRSDRKGREGATGVGLQGDLGSGKTSFVQGVARALGVAEHVTSPTFILERIYKLPIPKPNTYNLSPTTFSHLIHIDAYRLDSVEELAHLGFEELTKEKENLILIEWPERVAHALPKNMLTIKFEFIDENIRKIEMLQCEYDAGET